MGSRIHLSGDGSKISLETPLRTTNYTKRDLKEKVADSEESISLASQDMSYFLNPLSSWHQKQERTYLFSLEHITSLIHKNAAGLSLPLTPFKRSLETLQKCSSKTPSVDQEEKRV